MKNLNFLFAMLLAITVIFYISCSDKENSYDETLVVASENVKTTEGIAYWVKTSKENNWRLMHQGIYNFNYESGYEYVIKVRFYKNENPGPDQPSYNCYLLSIISKEKKNSEVPLFTTDISLIGNHYEVAFPNKMREVITLPCGIKLEKVDFKTRTGYRRAKTLCIRYLILSFNNFKRH